MNIPDFSEVHQCGLDSHNNHWMGFCEICRNLSSLEDKFSDFSDPLGFPLAPAAG